ncbi:MAG: hypothetical protein M1830_002200 [Pleopsidium flavum]|nr:MAG: hypothetical protein M1830_002200 [Pleopsidium flavum]
MSFRLQHQPSIRKPGTPFTKKLTHLTHALHPLLSLTTSAPHPAFPRTLLHYHLLSSSDLDSLAAYYHQLSPNPYMYLYPYTENGRSLGWSGGEGMGIEEKRRKFGRFVGLTGCETPVTVGVGESGSRGEGGEGGEGGREGDGKEVRERMERDWRRGVERGRERDVWRAKGGYY